VLHAEQRAEHVGVKGRGIAFRRLVNDGAGFALRAGIVDGNIDAAEAGDGVIDEAANIVVLTDVGADKDGVCTEFAKFGFERFAFARPMPVSAPVITTTGLSIQTLRGI